MASGLQCPGCGHVHPSGLPEIARGDATFRCYGCYRTLSVPEGWSGRPAPRPAPTPVKTADAPPGAGTRDARSARLAARRGGRGEPTEMVGQVGDPTRTDRRSRRSAGGDPTEMVPIAGSEFDGGSGTGWSESRAPGTATAGAAGVAGAGLGARGTAGSPSARRGAGGAPLGWVSRRKVGRPVPVVLRAAVWAVAFGVGFILTAFVLKAVGILGVSNAIDLYAGTGVHRFGFLLVLLPMWALVSATVAHFSLEALGRRRRPPADSRPPAAAGAPDRLEPGPAALQHDR